MFLVSLKHSFQTTVESSVVFSIGYIALRKSNCEENSPQAKAGVGGVGGWGGG